MEGILSISLSKRSNIIKKLNLRRPINKELILKLQEFNKETSNQRFDLLKNGKNTIELCNNNASLPSNIFGFFYPHIVNVNLSSRHKISTLRINDTISYHRNYGCVNRNPVYFLKDAIFFLNNDKGNIRLLLWFHMRLTTISLKASSLLTFIWPV